MKFIHQDLRTESFFPYCIVYCPCVRVGTIAEQFAFAKNKGKFVPFHTIKAHKESGGMTPLILNLGG